MGRKFDALPFIETALCEAQGKFYMLLLEEHIIIVCFDMLMAFVGCLFYTYSVAPLCVYTLVHIYI